MSSPPSSSPLPPPSSAPPHSRASTTASTDSNESIIEQLSFEYVCDEEGNIVRKSNGSSNDTPPTSPGTQELGEKDPPSKQNLLQPPSAEAVVLNSPLRRMSLSRSESAFPVLNGPATATSDRERMNPARSFQRVASGPILSTTSSGNNASTSAPIRPLPRRVDQQYEARQKRNTEELRAKLMSSSADYQPSYLEEKENIRRHSNEIPTVEEVYGSRQKRPSNEVPTVEELYGSRPKRHAEELRAKLMASSADLQPSYPEEKENIRRISNEVPSVEEMHGSGSRHSVATASASSSTASHPTVPRLALPVRSAYGSQSLSAISRPLGEASLPQRPLPTRRVLKTNVSSAASRYHIDRISEVGPDAESAASEGDGAGRDYPYGAISSVPLLPYNHSQDTDDEADAPSPAPLSARPSQGSSSMDVNPLSQSGNTRPRRSASLSDALFHEDEHHAQPSQVSHQPRQLSRPGTSLGLRREVPAVPVRRLTIEDRPEVEYKNYPDTDRDDYHLQVRQSPSPTHNAPSHQQPVAQAHSRSTYTHKRRDSDTLRSVAHAYPTGSMASPVAESRVPPRLSPSAKGLPSPGATVGPSSVAAGANAPVKHRRSPTAPEPPTTSGSLQAGAPTVGGMGKTWAAGERDSGEGYDGSGQNVANENHPRRERERERSRSQQHPKAQSLPQSVPQASGPAPPPGQPGQQPPNGHPTPTPSPRQMLLINRKAYARLDMIGKGGSSRVYRVMNNANELYAIKRVSLDSIDAETMTGYMNEIALLKRLDGNKRIIRLIDSEVKGGAGGSKGFLYLLMECGEIDLARLISERIHEGLDMIWIAYYWQQMLQAVQVIHEEKIVHSDLKPANFVLVKGQLKLIDFGIASAIANDTTNIQRDQQIGTLNYMSPEAIELPEGQRRKVGRPSDVWSLGCILYQMIYGQAPFSHLSMYQKMKAIPDPKHEIDFPEYSVPIAPKSKSSSHQGEPKKLEHLKRRVRQDVIGNMQSCLCRNPKDRMTIPELLDQDWLAMKEPKTPAAKDLLDEKETIITPFYMRQLLEYGIRLGSTNSGPQDAEALLAEAERLVNELKSVQTQS